VQKYEKIPNHRLIQAFFCGKTPAIVRNETVTGNHFIPRAAWFCAQNHPVRSIDKKERMKLHE
jgi:hypothetical protein